MRIIKRRISYLLIVSLFFAFFPNLSQAASLTSLSDTMSRIKDSELSDHTVKSTTPTGAGDTTDTITIAFPSGFTIGSVNYTDIDLSHGASTGYETEEALAATADATSWGAAFSGQTLTLTHPTNAANGDIAASDKIVVEIGDNATGGSGNDQIQNQTVAQNNTDPKIVIDGTFGDDGTIAVEIVADDQIPVTATVDPTITFTLENTALNLGTLSSSSVKTPEAPNTESDISIGTNGSGGYTISIKGQGSGSGDGLYNAAASKLIASAAGGLVAGTEGYGGQCQVDGSPSGSCASAFNYWGADTVGELGLSYATLASYGLKPSTTDTFDFRVKAAISTSTDAGTYNDTVTIVASANF